MKDYSFSIEETYQKTYDLLFGTNIFSILKFDSSEIRHTNMIEWLLCLNHYQGLKKLVEWHNKMNINVSDIDEKTITFYNDKPFNILFDNINISNRPDLLIKFSCNDNDYYILIENKINAFENEYEEGKYQTQLYYEQIQEHNIANVFYVFLDVRDNDPKCSEYQRLNYDDFYNNIIKIKKLDVLDSNDRFIYTQYVNSLMRPIFRDDQKDFMTDTIYAIDRDINYDSMYSDEINDYIKKYYSKNNHSADEIKDYLTIKYIYYCIYFKHNIRIDEEVRNILFGKREYHWKLNGIYSTKLDIVKKICTDLYDNNNIEILDNIKVSSSDKLIVHNLEDEGKRESWIKYCRKNNRSIDEFYDKLPNRDLYVRNYIVNKTMQAIANELNKNNTEFQLEEN